MSLDELITRARSAASSDDPIDQLSAAAGLKVELDEEADAMLGHFVDQARRAGCTWSQIGGALGVSKQAAQQKHKFRIGDLSRLTDRARSAIEAAQAASRAFGHSWVGTEHVLLGLSHIGEGVAEVILTGAGLDRERLDAMVVERFPRAGEGLAADTAVTFTPRALAVLEQSIGEALKLGHNYVGTEHILLSLARPGSGMAADLLVDGGLDQDGVRAKVIEILRTYTK